MSKRKRKPESSASASSESKPASFGKSTNAVASRSSGMFEGRGLLLTCIGLFVLVFLVFSPALTNDFVHYDDADYVLDNPHVKAGITSAGISWAFTTGHSANWHPLTWISHMLDCQLYGLKPWGHHLTSILLHSLNAVLLFVLLRRMTGANWRSLIVALLFGLHPLRVESVAWVAERKDVLSTFFWMLTALAYVGFVRERTGRGPKAKQYYALSLLFYACGLMSKPMVVTLPFVLLLLDWWPLQRIGAAKAGAVPGGAGVSVARAAIEKVPYLALAAASSVVTFLVQQHGDVMSVGVSLTLRLENAIVSYCRYLGKLFWPVDLAVIYPHPLHWPIGLVITCAVILLVITCLAWTTRKSFPLFAVGWCWFVGMLVPVIGIVQVGSQSMADRYSYLPTAGILMAMVWGAGEIVRRRAAWKGGLVGVAVCAIVASAAVTANQMAYWKNSETLFRHALDVTTDNVVALVNLGEALSADGKSDGALAAYDRALKIRPDYFEAMNNAGVELVKLKKLDQAIGILKKAVDIDGTSPRTHNNLGQAFSDAGNYDAAIAQFKEALRLKPDYAGAEHNWGIALVGRHDLDGAITHFETAVRMDPFHFDARKSLGIAYYYKGRFDDAIEQNLLALKIRPKDPGVLQNLQVAREDKAAQKSGNPTGPRQ